MRRVFLSSLAAMISITSCIHAEEQAKEKFDKELTQLFEKEAQKRKGMVYFGKHARYSEDGRYIVFQVVRNNKEILCLFDYKANRLIRYFSGTYDRLRYPIFSRSGEILFNASYLIEQGRPGKGITFIRTIDMQASNIRTIMKKTNTAIISPTIYADGKSVISIQYNNENPERIFEYDLVNGRERMVLDKELGEISELVALNDNRTILFTAGGSRAFGGGELYSYSLNTGQLKKIREFAKLVYSNKYSNEILIYDYDQESNAGLYRLNIQNGRSKKVCNITNRGNWFYDFSLSPDGKKVMYISAISISMASKTNLIMEMNLDGSGLRSLPVDLGKLDQVPVVNIDQGLDIDKYIKQ